MFSMTREELSEIVGQAILTADDQRTMEHLRLVYSECDESSHGMPFFRFSVPVGGDGTSLRMFFRINQRKDGAWTVQTYGDESVESVCELDGCLERVMRSQGFGRTGNSQFQVMAKFLGCPVMSFKGAGFHWKLKCGNMTSALVSVDLLRLFLSNAVISLFQGLEKHGRRGILEACDRKMSRNRAFANGLKIEDNEKKD